MGADINRKLDAIATAESAMSEWIHLDAGHDKNGNPRRCYVCIDDGAITKVADEGYLGVGAAHKAGMPRTYWPPTFATTPREYNSLLEEFPE